MTGFDFRLIHDHPSTILTT